MLLSRRILLGAAAVALLITPLARADQALRWKFKEGEKLQYALESKSDILVDAGGVEFDISTGQIMDMTWTVKKVNPDGSAEVGQSIDRLQLMINSPLTGEFKYDSKEAAEKKDEEQESEESATPGPGGQIAQQFVPILEKLIGKEITMTITPQGEVKDIKLPEELIALLNNRSEQGGGRGSFFAMLMGGGFSEDSIKELLQRTVTLLPKEVPSTDTQWSREFVTKLGDAGEQKTVTKFAYEGVEERDGKKLAKIATTDETTIELKEDSDADIELEIVEQDAGGEILFDVDAGRVVEAKATLKMEIEGDFMGNEIYQERESTTILVQGTSDNLPKADEEEDASSDDSSDAN